MKKLLSILLVAVMLITSCEPVYKAANFQETAN